MMELIIIKIIRGIVNKLINDVFVKKILKLKYFFIG